MPLAAGTRLGPYDILGVIGAGGMGEGYKARDTRLDRTVAIKILPAALSADPDRRVRFEREAQPAWRADGRALFFVGPGRNADTRQMMEVDVQPGPPLRLGTPKPLFEYTVGDLLFTSTQVRAYDVTPDGKQFFVFQERPRPPMAPVTHVNLIQNWFEELKAKVPAGGAK